MARSSCMKCGGTRFEVVTQVPWQSNFKLNFVQCASCGAVVGVLDYFNVGAMLDKSTKSIESALDTMKATVDDLTHRVRQMGR